MIEIIALCLLTLSIAVCLFSPSGMLDQIKIPEDSTLRRHFLTHLRNEDASLAAKLERRLAKAR